MATTAANTQRQTIGSEEYSLYSSLSEDELIKMAIQQSLEEDPTGQPAAQSHQKSMVAGPGEVATPSRASSHNPPYHIYPWQRWVSACLSCAVPMNTLPGKRKTPSPVKTCAF